MKTAFLIFRSICYVALAIVTLGFVGMLVLSHPDVCSSLSTGSISCRSEGLEELAELTIGILLVSAFTGLPVLLALIGLFFALRAAAPKIANIYRTIRPAPAPTAEAMDDKQTGRSALQNLGRAGKIIAYIVGAFFFSAMVAGIYEATVH